jgi:hypothetical protein
LISGTRGRRRKAMVWSAIVSAVFHVLVLALLFYAFARIVMTPEGSGEQVSEHTTISVEAPIKPKPVPKRHQLRKPVILPPPPAPARHELAKESVAATPQPPERPHPVAVTAIQRDRTAFAKEVAQLNQRNDPHAIPTTVTSTRIPAALRKRVRSPGPCVTSPTRIRFTSRRIRCRFRCRSPATHCRPAPTCRPSKNKCTTSGPPRIPRIEAFAP